MKVPFDCSVAEMKTIKRELLGFYMKRIGSKWVRDALLTGLNYDEFRVFNAAAFKVSQDIKFDINSKTHQVLWSTPSPFVSAKRLLGWFITGKDFEGFPQGKRWSSYAEVLGEHTFPTEIAKAFREVSEGNNFEFAFVDAARFTEGAKPEGDLVPVLTWIKPAMGPENGPYKTAALKAVPEAPEAPEPAEAMPLQAAAGAGGGSWADMATETVKPVQETKVSDPEKEEFTELQMTSAIMLLQTLVGPKHALTHKTIDTLATELVKAAQKLITA